MESIITSPSTQAAVYPPSPSIDSTGFLDPTPAFKAQVRRTLTGIVAFGFLYVLLIAFGLVLGYLCAMGAMMLITVSVNKFTILIGLGLVALAGMFLLFLIKFIFGVHKNESNQRVEITAGEHPRLFAFIDQLTDEVNSPKPYRIYLTPDVNASVFYNSSFWSLFLPVRKNLEIGLGLVNSVNMSEFKAVMAHEFGHFSQRSMKLGSYVYIVYRVIYDLVYDRDRWDDLLAKWASSGGLWSVFASLTLGLVNIVRKVLVLAYQWLSLRHKGLSRQMEYQADLVAVSAAGNSPAVSALRRIVIGSTAFHTCMRQVNALYSESKAVTNLFEIHRLALREVAGQNEIPLRNGLPDMADAHALKLKPANRVNYEDQWASHPSMPEREANINTVNAPCIVDETSPWTLFNDPDRWQQKLTAHMYENVDATEPSGTRQFLSLDEFRTYTAEEEARYTLPDVYNGFYDGRLLFTFDPAVTAVEAGELLVPEAIFTDQHVTEQKQLFAALGDRDTLEQIKNGRIQVRSFDFDGVKYQKNQINEVFDTLSNEVNDRQNRMLLLEKAAFRWYYARAAEQGNQEDLLERYVVYFRLDQERQEYDRLFTLFRLYFQHAYEEAQNGGDLSKRTKEAIDELNKLLQQAFAVSETLVFPAEVEGLPFSGKYTAYLCGGALQEVSGELFNWDSMVGLFKQLEEIAGKTGQIQFIFLTDLLRKQATLS